MKKLLLLIFSLVTLAGYSQTTLSANPDTFTVIQARIDTLAVTSNDSIPLGDSVCITLVDTAHFSVLGCTIIVYRPDSTFTGRDTCRYVLCDTALICDTSMVVIYVDTNRAFYLPSVSFKEDTTLPGFGGGYHPQARLFSCNHLWDYTVNCVIYRLVNTSLNYDSVSWVARFHSHYICNDSLKIFSGDTILFDFDQPCVLPDSVSFCLTAFNRFGSTTTCKTSCHIDICEGISEVPLTHINLYPTPASQALVIDMSQNTDDISTHYTAIDLYNALGQKIRTISKQNNSKIINVPVATLPDGIYLATISDATHTERMLGKFTIAK